MRARETERTEKLKRKQREGESVGGPGEPAENVVPQLEKILREELKLPIHLTLTQAERDVIVVGGKYESKPLANRKENQVDLFAVKPSVDGAGGGSGTFDEFLVAVGTYLGRRLANDVATPPHGRIVWYYHNSHL